MHIVIINGPNLNMLGRREPDIYGSMSMGECLQELRETFPDLDLRYFQSNSEGAIIDRLQECGLDPDCAGVALNAGAYTHTSLAIADAIRSVELPVVEVHLSNTAAREPIRHTSLIGPACVGVVAGFGMLSYRLAIMALLARA